MKIQAKDPAAELSLNLAPMIDVVFLLLIFFMVATTFASVEKEMDLDLPTAETGEAAENPLDEVVVNIAADGTLQVDGEAVDGARLREILARAARANPKTPVTIRGDRASQLQRVTEVMDACRQTGLFDVGIMTRDAR
ncbi:MAG: biopolymer transporter ExbD [Planctomycetota bacterium]